MAGLSDHEKALLARQLQDEFNKTDTVIEGSGSVQRYSESTRTLYSDEELAKKMIHSYIPFREEKEERDLSTDEMLQLLKEDNNRKTERVVRKGYAKIESQEGKWHS